jgi:hypothetical protein
MNSNLHNKSITFCYIVPLGVVVMTWHPGLSFRQLHVSDSFGGC